MYAEVAKKSTHPLDKTGMMRYNTAIRHDTALNERNWSPSASRGKEMRGSSAATAIAVITRGRVSAGMLTVACRETVLGHSFCWKDSLQNRLFRHSRKCFFCALSFMEGAFSSGKEKEMKQTKKLFRVVPLLLLALILLAACSPTPASWENAKYTKDATVGNGATAVTLKVTADEKTVTITLHTDKTDLAEALLAEELCAGEEGAFGLYIKYVNGIRADYELDGGYYWNLTVNGEPSMVGASGTPIIGGTVYEFIRTK